jgi:uncharacterized protein YjdB
MASTKHKLRLAGAFAALAMLALAVSCTGFFVNPTVSTISILPPSPTVTVGFTTQLNAAGTDSNGNPITLTGGTSCTGTTVCWSSDTPSVATISTGGTLTGVSAGTSSITAASGTATASTTATVTLANVTSIVLSPDTSFSMAADSTAGSGNGQCLKALATAGGQTGIDVTASVTWQTGTPSIITPQGAEDPECVQSGSSAGSTTLFAQYTSGSTIINSESITVTVNGP